MRRVIAIHGPGSTRRRPVLAVGLTILLIGVTVSRAADGTISLVDVAAEAGVTLLNLHGDATKDFVVDANGNGAAWFDYDGDGDMDALIVGGSTRERIAAGGDRLVTLYRNDGRGRFADVTLEGRLERRGWGMGACVADYDNNGTADVYVTAFGTNALYRNTGNGTFMDVTRTAGVGEPRWSMNCAFGDYDRDGDVDLYVANHLVFDGDAIPGRSSSVCTHEGLAVYCGPRGLVGESDTLYRNDGDGTFTDVSKAAGIAEHAYYGFGVLFSDLDDDGWPDIFVANDSVPNLWFRNRGDGTFSEEGLIRGLALDNEGREQASMGAAAGDYNGDGHLDVIVTNFSEDYNTLYGNDPIGVFSDVTYQAGLGTSSWWRLGWGVGFVDIDNDALLDVFVANGHVYPDVGTLNRGSTYNQANQLFRNLGTGQFQDVSRTAGPGLRVERSSRGAAFGDYDNDGDVDVLVVNMNDRPTLLRNETNQGHHWVTIRLVGTASNRDGIGARITLTARGRTQTSEVRSGGSYLSHHDLRAHFGLGDAAVVERVRIRWPSGTLDTIEALPSDSFYDIREGAGRAIRIANDEAHAVD